MRKTTKLALAYIALAGAVGGAAYAENLDSANVRERTMMRLDKTMKDNDGKITFDQFSDVMDARLKKLVADNGGKLTVAQLADALERRASNAWPGASSPVTTARTTHADIG
ncbi:hypothetical protein [Mesorhizobium sp. BR-1-1-10]|uniref:hypothetical protein n=1 Tax=Mesorhizobium sp. BR-1-1-10 TaxID=2876660 RepID=UPI001CD0FE63|nr:hypothetical protein [Mesorhizobium sp. BR-1-1-10]MBZ9977833.1 hypothetical protein [Mesorhizobium sp. BR-1-1-10]